MKDKNVFLICNSHLDPIYLWKLNEGIVEAVSTFRVAAEFCENYEGFIFNHNEALLYEYVREHEPALFKRIQLLVSQGRWHIMGGWYLQPDCNLPSGESLVRQVLSGKAYFEKYFNCNPTTAINFDSFGHTRGLVQILKKCGYDSYIFCRPGVHEYTLETEDFLWTGFDGSHIIAHRSAEHYNTARGYAKANIEAWLKAHPESENILYLWGIGNHGGGPSRIDLENINQMIRENEEYKIVHSTPEKYFKAIKHEKEKLSEVKEDLNPVAQGSYTNLIQIKQKHRQLENSLYMAEKMLSHAALLNLLEYPRKELNKIQEDLMLSEFHDVLAGSVIREAESEVLRFMDHGLELAKRLKMKAFFSLTSGQEEMETGRTPIFIYNPHPYEVSGVFECEYGLPQNHNAGIFEGDNLVIEDGNKEDIIIYPTVYQEEIPLPSQMEQHHSHKPFEWRKRSVFYATLKPYSMSRFDCTFTKRSKEKLWEYHSKNSDFIFDNGEMSVVIDSKTGFMTSYKVNGQEYIAKNAFYPLVMEDNYDAYGWGARAFDKIIGKFELMDNSEAKNFRGFPESDGIAIRIVEDGEVRIVVEVLLKYETSCIAQFYKIPKRGTEIEVEMCVYWNEKGRLLKLSIPTVLTQGEYLGQTAYGVQTLSTNREESCSHKWAGLFEWETNKALSWSSDSGYGSDYMDGELRLTLLRSPLYLSTEFHPTNPPYKNRFYPRSDQGERVFHFWINAGAADERRDNVDREVLPHHEQPFILSMNPSGKGDKHNSLFIIEDSAVQMTTFKKEEDSNMYVIRLFETTGKERITLVSLPALGIRKEINMKGYEIKTLILDVENNRLYENEGLCI